MYKLLVVDDEKEIVELLKWHLTTLNYEVFTSTSALDALEVLANCDVDLLITDIKMPGMNGIELIEKTSRHWPEIQSIVITGHGDVDTAIEAMKLGAINYLSKPVGVDALETAIKKGIEKIKLVRSVKEKQKRLEAANEELKNQRERLEEIVKERTQELTLANTALSNKMAERRRSEDILRKSHDELENKVAEYSLHLSVTNKRLEEEIAGRIKADKAREQLDYKQRILFNSIPTPACIWKCMPITDQTVDFILTECNDMAVQTTNGSIKNLLNKKASEIYSDQPEIILNMKDCFINKNVIDKQLKLKVEATGDAKYLATRYAYVHPDLLLMYTDDVMVQVLADSKLRETEETCNIFVAHAANELDNLCNLLTGKINQLKREISKNMKALECLSDIEQVETSLKELSGKFTSVLLKEDHPINVEYQCDKSADSD